MKHAGLVLMVAIIGYAVLQAYECLPAPLDLISSIPVPQAKRASAAKTNQHTKPNPNRPKAKR